MHKHSGKTIRRLKPLAEFLAEIGVSASTGFRWRQSGYLKAININGRNYVSADEIEAFHRRAEYGEFSRKPN